MEMQADLLVASNYITACASSAVSTETTRRTAAFQKDNDDPADHQRYTRAVKRTGTV